VKTLEKPPVRIAIAALIIAATVVLFRSLVHFNPATVGFTLLLTVLIISAAWGLKYAILYSIVATLAYNYFFLPPFGTFSIADPQNWIALGAFLFTAAIASQLAERARRQALIANRRRAELERLYAFSQQMLAAENVLVLVNSVPRLVSDTFGGRGCGMFLSDRNKVYYSDIRAQRLVNEEALKQVAVRAEPSSDANKRLMLVPLRMGIRSVGALALADADVGRETLDAVATLIAIAVERAGAVEELAHAEANRESDRLRSILLDSVTHDFRTPLTSIKASAESLLGETTFDEHSRRELLTVINEESDRLDRLVGEAAQMAQLDSGTFELHVEPHHMREAIDAAVVATKNALAKHTVTVVAPESLPMLRMDLRRIGEVLAQLLDNAAKYSPAGTEITITTELQDDNIVTSVADHGLGIDEIDQGRVFEKFYRGREQRSTVKGTGMGLAIAKALVEAHRGSIGVVSQLERGSVFSFSLPLEA
jgi:two-component system sensor histidine kinase KdpD